MNDNPYDHNTGPDAGNVMFITVITLTGIAALLCWVFNSVDFSNYAWMLVVELLAFGMYATIDYLT